MKKTKSILVGLGLVIGLFGLVVTGCKKSEQEHGAGADHAHQYTCSMHPEVVQDKPGTCSKCNMKLVEKH